MFLDEELLKIGRSIDLYNDESIKDWNREWKLYK